jgi:hypothetical protein
MIAWLVTLLAPPVVAWLVVALLLRTASARWLADLPNARSLHARPTPRLGGLGVLAGALPLIAWHADRELAVVLACAAFLAIVSLADDVRSLPVQVRLPAHVAAASVTVMLAWHGDAQLAAWAALAWIVAIAWLTNLFNFMDGADGLAGGMAAVGFGALALAAHEASPALALACAALAAACIGFLAQLPARARVHGRRGLDTAGIPRGCAVFRRRVAQRVARVVPAARVLALHRRCECHARAARIAARARMARAPLALLPAAGGRRMDAQAPRARGLWAHARRRRERPRGP